MGIAKLVIGDAAITFLWSMYIAAMSPATAFIVSSLGLQGYELLVVLGLLATNVFFFGWLGAALGGAFWNPAPILAFHSVGLGNTSLFALAARFPAQAAGAVGGVLAARELIPSSYSHLLGGPDLKVHLYTGIVAEIVLTFAITFAILVTILRGPKSNFIKNWIITFCTLGVVILGAEYTGPALNPANAFGWAYINEKHNTLEHFLVYWLSPLAGSLIAALVFQLIFSISPVKEKTA